MDYKKVLRLHYVNGLSSRAIAESCGCGKTTVVRFLKRFSECGKLSYPLSEDVTNEFIESQLCSQRNERTSQQQIRIATDSTKRKSHYQNPSKSLNWG